MRRWLFPLACLALAALAAFLLWAWSTDYFLRRDCARHAGHWDAEKRSCVIQAQPAPESIASLPG
jgi:hypothetical protein